jgi:hypothetical protein
VAFIDKNANVKVLKYQQIAHMRELKRAGVNPASGGFPAGSKVNKLIRSGGKKGRGY